jgi:hypothetical protein
VLDGHEPGRMPEPIRRMVEGVRGELRGELSSIAGALRAAADRTERTEQTLASLPAETTVPSAAKPEIRAAEPTLGHPLVAARVGTSSIMPERDQMIPGV